MTGIARRSDRIVSLDIIRGAVMVLMAIDHVRVYSGVPAGAPTPGVFFTRWITHFCAPAFVFLAGTAAFLYGERIRDRARLSRFLATRGLFIVLLELTVVRLFWTFNFDFANYILAGVLWVIGWSMIVMALLVRLPLAWIAGIGAVLVGAHNMLGPLTLESYRETATGKLLYFGGAIGPLAILYVLIPWLGVMALGYAFGAVMRMEPERRRRLCYGIGLGSIAAFVLLRFFNLYGDPRPWSGERMPAALSFLNTTKYPASLLFLLMTLGPVVALVPILDRARGRVADVLATFGRVPLFYYLLHIPLIHVLSLIVSMIREGRVNPWLFANHPLYAPDVPEGYMWSLGLLYLVTAVAVVLLYFPCRWFAEYKARRGGGWSSYL